MTLSAGTKLGPYEILAPLGAGGMGEVYRARDTRLDRDVAIKVLPPAMAADPERIARFEREAKSLATLSHPNIAAIYGFEQCDGVRFLVMELTEGENLSDRLARGALPVDEAREVAHHIAEALDAAHEKGIVHRDLKPANIKISTDGVVKVLDFGLAKAMLGEGGSIASMSPTEAINSPTITAEFTRPGVILGTAGYMSPEQARGRSVDKRSDVWSFGCVFFECLSGARLFAGETATDSIGAILHREPEWALLPPVTPQRIRELLKNCLAKDRKNRLHDIADARIELERAITGREWLEASESTSARRSGVRPAIAGAAAFFFLAIGGLLGSLFMRPAPGPAPQPFHLSVATPPKPELNDFYGISPDARFIVYRVWPDREADSPKPGGLMMVRRLDSDKAEPIPGTEGVLKAAISPDGRWVAFTAAKDRARSKVSHKKVALNNGDPAGLPETLCDLPAAGHTNVCWSSDREIALAQAWNRTILTVPASGGEPRVALPDDAAHGPNEHFSIARLRRGIQTCARFYDELTKSDG